MIRDTHGMEGIDFSLAGIPQRNRLCVRQGRRKKKNEDALVPCILEPDGSSKEYRKSTNAIY
jgi:hypothetical protein